MREEPAMGNAVEARHARGNDVQKLTNILLGKVPDADEVG